MIPSAILIPFLVALVLTFPVTCLGVVAKAPADEIVLVSGAFCIAVYLVVQVVTLCALGFMAVVA